MERDLYAVLGIKGTADADAIRRAFRTLAIEHHPDQSGDSNTERFREIREAYEVLSEPTRREAYDNRRNTSATFIHTGVANQRRDHPIWKDTRVHIGRSSGFTGTPRRTRRPILVIRLVF